MKKILLRLSIVGLLSLPVILFAQTPPHPNGGNPPGGGNIPVGGGAPIGSGLIFMVLLSGAYGSKKLFDLRKKLQ